MNTKRGLDQLIDIMARLRDPETGCPWDREQTFASIAPSMLEESYELVEAIENNDIAHIKEELGDVLFQIAFHAQIGREAGWFDLDAVAQAVADKMVERHPHVFGAGAVAVVSEAPSAEVTEQSRLNINANEVAANWEADKEAKRRAKAAAAGHTASILDGVSTGLPAATRAVKIQNRAARVGFDWDNPRDIVGKIREEIGELEEEMSADAQALHPNHDAIEDEMGDVLFAVVNLARKLGIDPESALRRTNRKFERRFRGIEEKLAQQGRNATDASLNDMERLWREIKLEEKPERGGTQ